MRSFASWMIAAAALAAAAGGASAQTLKAEVPYTFRVGKATMPPGSYDIMIGQNGVVSFSNREAKRSATVIAEASEDPKKEWLKSGEPRMALECAENVCAIARLWAADDNPAIRFHGLKTNAEMHMAFVPLTVAGR